MCSMATLISLSSIPRISSLELSKIILSETLVSANVDAPAPHTKFAIIDVRDNGKYCTYFTLVNTAKNWSSQIMLEVI